MSQGVVILYSKQVLRSDGSMPTPTRGLTTQCCKAFTLNPKPGTQFYEGTDRTGVLNAAKPKYHGQKTAWLLVVNLTRNIGSGASHKELGLRALMDKAVGVRVWG